MFGLTTPDVAVVRPNIHLDLLPKDLLQSQKEMFSLLHYISSGWDYKTFMSSVDGHYSMSDQLNLSDMSDELNLDW